MAESVRIRLPSFLKGQKIHVGRAQEKGAEPTLRGRQRLGHLEAAPGSIPSH
jgi:hypothetical protein